MGRMNYLPPTSKNPKLSQAIYQPQAKPRADRQIATSQAIYQPLAK